MAMNSFVRPTVSVVANRPPDFDAYEDCDLDYLLQDSCLTAHPGDIIYVQRYYHTLFGVPVPVTYKHYGVYIGDDKIIHFASKKEDDPAEIHETTIIGFLDNLDIYDGFFILDFSKYDGKVYSAAQTIKRAKSKIGEMGYDLLDNNCEHFAMWCKTGIKRSRQTERIARRGIGYDQRLYLSKKQEDKIIEKKRKAWIKNRERREMIFGPILY